MRFEEEGRAGVEAAAAGQASGQKAAGRYDGVLVMGPLTGGV